MMKSSDMDVSKSVVLNDGNKMPVIALGTSRMPTNETAGLIKTAVDLGYRHIDTAQFYLNCVQLGDALHDILSSGQIQRKDLFITTKLAPYFEKPGDLEDGLKRHLLELKLDYVDACLIHFPISFKLKLEAYIETNKAYPKDMSEFGISSSYHINQWQELENLKQRGLIRSIGLSNFSQKQIENILEHTRIPPSILQVECHIYLQIPELIGYCNAHQIFVTCFAALGSPGIEKYIEHTGNIDNILTDPVVKSIAESHGKSASQIALRYCIQRGLGIVCKSSNEARMKQNLNLFDFSLSPTEVETLSKLDKDQRIFHFRYMFKEADDAHSTSTFGPCPLFMESESCELFRSESYHLYPFSDA